MEEKDDEQLQAQNEFVEATTKVKGHDCELLQAEHPIVNYICNGAFVELRRKFRIMMLVNPDDPDSKAKLRSTAKIREDQERHLLKYYYMIHPYSRCRLYLKTYFIFDFLCAIPTIFTLGLFGLGVRPWTHAKVIFVLRLARIGTFSNYLGIFLERRGLVSGLYLKILRAVLALIIIFAWGIGLRCYLRELREDRNHKDTIKRSIREVVSKLMLVGVGTNLKSIGIGLCLKDIFFLTSGSFLTKYMLLQVMNIYKRKSGTRHIYEETMMQMDEYISYKRIPPHLKAKIYHYLDFKYQKQIFKEDDLLSVLSSTLVEEVRLHKCKKLVDKVELFKEVPITVLMKIISKLRLETYLPKDIIVQAGKHGNSMYFISEGTVAVYTTEGVEMCHLKPSDHFGEIALVIRKPRIATVTAVDECEMYKLSRKDFQQALLPYPNVYMKIRQEAISRLKQVEGDLHQSIYNMSTASVLF